MSLSLSPLIKNKSYHGDLTKLHHISLCLGIQFQCCDGNIFTTNRLLRLNQTCLIRSRHFLATEGISQLQQILFYFKFPNSTTHTLNVRGLQNLPVWVELFTSSDTSTISSESSDFLAAILNFDGQPRTLVAHPSQPPPQSRIITCGNLQSVVSFPHA